MNNADLAEKIATDHNVTKADARKLVDGVFAAIEAALDVAEPDIDSELSGGILTLEFGNHSKVIVNRQTFNREIWVAARSGGFHFKSHSDTWIDTKSGEDLYAKLAVLIAAQGGYHVTF